MSAASSNGELRNAPVPVARPVTALEPRRRLLLALPLPRGPVALAASGVTAGALVVTILRAIRGRRRARVGRHRRRDVRRTIVGTRSFLVDVHLLGK
jgi:hypothetical protein